MLRNGMVPLSTDGQLTPWPGAPSPDDLPVRTSVPRLSPKSEVSRLAFGSAFEWGPRTVETTSWDTRYRLARELT